jgi:hypothetical protein
MSEEQENEQVGELGIQLDENFWLSWDSMGYCLRYVKMGEINPATGKESKTSQHSYHATLIQSLNKYVDTSLKASTSITDMKVRLEEIMAQIASIEVRLRRYPNE